MTDTRSNTIASDGSPATRDSLGDRCKSFEQQTDTKAMTGLPLLARLDGRAFHTFTRGLERPYDAGMSRLMIETTRYLVCEFHAAIGYTQSDEITLAWVPKQDADVQSQYPFDGRIQKLTSVLAGTASVAFHSGIPEHLPTKVGRLPVFDCRVWQVPTLKDALDVFVWREDDATKNSITMAASAYYSHRELQGKHSGDKHEMLHAKGVNWNDYPAFFKRGMYLQRKLHERSLTDGEWERIPKEHRPLREQVFTRASVDEITIPPIRKVANAIECLFEGAEPKTRTPDGYEVVTP